MNIANKITITRIIMVPFFMFFFNFNSTNNSFKYIALLIFVSASITDFIDGFIAKKFNLTTNLGKFLDPLADKILISAAFLSFLELKLINIFIVFAMLSREFLVIGIRLVASKNGKVIAANFWGKLKTISQIAASIATMLYAINNNLFLLFFYRCLIYISTFFTILSGFLYILQNKKVLFEN